MTLLCGLFMEISVTWLVTVILLIISGFATLLVSESTEFLLHSGIVHCSLYLADCNGQQMCILVGKGNFLCSTVLYAEAN